MHCNSTFGYVFVMLREMELTLDEGEKLVLELEMLTSDRDKCRGPELSPMSTTVASACK
jgi:hypothetical protein